MASTINLGLTLVAAGAGAEALVNASLQLIDALLGGAVEDRDLTTPGTPTAGQRFIVKTTGTGAWTGHSNHIAHYVNGGWTFYTPPIGLTLWVKDEKITVRWDGTSWKTLVGDATIAVHRITTGETVLNAASWGALNWNGEAQKHSGVYDHDNSTNPDQVVLKEAGTYQVWWNVGVSASSAASNAVDTRLTINGSAVGQTLAGGTSHSTSNPRTNISGTAIITAAANDVLRVEAQRASGSSTISTVVDHTRLLVRRIGGA